MRNTNGVTFKTLDQKTRIVLINSDELVSQGYALLMNAITDYNVVDIYSNARIAVKGLAQDNPNIVIISYCGVASNFYLDVKKILKVCPEVNIIALVEEYQTNDAMEILKAGAMGIVIKSKNYHDLIDGIEEVVRGGAPLPLSVARAIVSSFHNKSNSSVLTDRQVQILEYLASGMTYNWIAEKLILSPDTIKSHIGNIYIKLHAKNKSEAIVKAKHSNII